MNSEQNEQAKQLQVSTQKKLNDMVIKNKELMQQLKMSLNENNNTKKQCEELQQKYEKQKQIISHLKNNIEKQRDCQNVHDIAPSKTVIQQMKIKQQEGTGQKQQLKVTQEIDQLEKIRRAEKMHRTREVQNAMDFESDPLDLDGDLNSDMFNQKHVMVENGQIDVDNQQIQSRKRLDDLSDDLSSIPSYDMYRCGELINQQLPGANGRNFDGHPQVNLNTEEDVLSRNFIINEQNNSIKDLAEQIKVKAPLDNLSSRPKDQLLFDQGNDIDLKDLDINEHDKNQTSYFSSRIGDSSEIDSEMLYAVQQAMVYQKPIQNLNTNVKNFMVASPESTILNNQRSSNRKQDKSPIKVPALNFNKVLYHRAVDEEVDEQVQQQLNQSMILEEGVDQQLTIQSSNHNKNHQGKQIIMPRLDFAKVVGQGGQGEGNVQISQQIQSDSEIDMPIGLPVKMQGASGGIKGLGLNLNKLNNPNKQNIQIKDFQDEFMEKVNEFSESWRNLIDKNRRF